MNNLYYMGLYSGDEYYRTSCSPDYNFLERNDMYFYNPNEGFIKGNIQKEIYQPYRNYTPKMPSVNSDKERLMLEIQKHCFYLIDLGLYLDMHPSDIEALKSFNETRSKYYRLVNEYNKNYNPLMFVDSTNNETYDWLKGNFPWSGR